MLKVENTIIEPSKIFVNDNFKIRIKVISVENTKYLIQNNFNLFCLANNHIYDYGKKGIENTLRFLDKNNVNYIGASVDNYNMYKRLDLIDRKSVV